MFYINPLLERNGINSRVPVKHPNQDDLFGLIHRMMNTQKANRIPIPQIRTKLDSLKRNSLINLNSSAHIEIETIAARNVPLNLVKYISDLDHIS